MLGGGFYNALQRFHAREYPRDIADLDYLKREPRQDGLAIIPPSILTGDPASLPTSKCFLVLGLNPGLPRKADVLEADVKPATAAWGAGFQQYAEHRRSYFAPGDRRYNGQHFSRLGNSIARAFGVAEGKEPWQVAQIFFQRHGAIMDLLPYWSQDTRNLDLGRIDYKRAPLSDWAGVIHAFIREKQPRAIIVNGSGQRSVVEALLDCSLAQSKAHPVYHGHAEGLGGIPILMHRQLSAQGALGIDAYRLAVEDWKQTVRFDFNR